MQCKNCGGPLVARYTRDYPINERGEYDEGETVTADVGVYCLNCGARHAYSLLWEGEGIHKGQAAIALEYESSPDPVATIVLSFENDAIVSIIADCLVGLVIDDRDHREVGGFLAQRNTEAWAAVQRLTALIKRGESRASYGCQSHETADPAACQCTGEEGHVGQHVCEQHGRRWNAGA